MHTSRNISAANGRSGNIRRKTPRIEQKMQFTIIAAMTIYSIIFLIKERQMFYQTGQWGEGMFFLLANDQYL